MRPRIFVLLLRLIHRIRLVSGRSWTKLLTSVISTLRKLASQPQVAELFRFIFLGTIVETGRQVAQWISNSARNLFVVNAEFAVGDFAYDWVVHYLENHRVWNQSRSFKVVARNAATRPYPTSNLGKIDGHPDPLYEPSTMDTPSLFRWRGYWMSITKSSAGWSHYDSAGYSGGYSGNLVLSVWSRNRHILDEFVSAAREFYIHSQILPRKQFSVKTEPSESLLTVNFSEGDVSYDWMLEYFRSSDAFKDIMELNATTRQTDLGWGTGPKDANRERNLASSGTQVRRPKLGHKQVLEAEQSQLHSSKREVLSDLINSAKQKYLEHGTSRVTVHLTDKYGNWGKTMTKSRRAFSTLVLPADIKEMILADAQEFLESEKYYKMAGIPHRRGYLLHGAPGTGKSSTVHAIESLASKSISYPWQTLALTITHWGISSVIPPSRCILLIEDIDCAFPSREDPDEDEEEDEEPQRDRNGNPIPRHRMLPPKSAVTLSGLLNVLDSVSSEEGRITFATTNHIENLDPALIRAGRMDLKIKYSLATTAQIEEVFKVFFSVSNEDDGASRYSADDIKRLATEFAATVPTETYSVAQIQGYLLRKKRNPFGAAQGVPEWIAEQEEEQRLIVEAKRRWREELARQRAAQEQSQYRYGPSPLPDGRDVLASEDKAVQVEANQAPDALPNDSADFGSVGEETVIPIGH
ncbi:p-loop containing nucleoside triphosphate hydrolase protein [Mycena sanguinolenta]|uniref:p-loop containing nucleoside triphosphate hydrolase protein n=1 Tax=Mycena sanguinolenta TaxID=230812 RepID=A0A8H6XHP5_9AGAR|nr:p-loop containing nucleoside triphosphate hydrolase protein [Mycena sanguinolenta]